MAQIRGDSSVVGSSAVFGGSVVARGVEGHSTNDHGVVGVTFGPGTGVFGVGTKGRGVEGESTENHAIVGTSKGIGTGVFGVGIKGRGVEGQSAENHAIVGTSQGIGTGVFGVGIKGRGVEGQSTENHAIVGTSKGRGAGVFGIADNGNGIEGHSTNQIGVFGKGGRLAGKFEGNVEVTGDIIMQNADCAEDFTIAGAGNVEPGTVMVLDEGGTVRPSDQAFDTRVAGVVSGAGTYKPALVLDRRADGTHRQPVALLGKVFCKVDATFGPIRLGDLLTSSPTPGHAMRAADASKAFGAVLGKALHPLASGQGLIPILVTLH